MTISYARYDLENGYIHNWIVAGPQVIPVTDREHFTGEDYRLQIARRYYTGDSGVTETPAELGRLALNDGTELAWRYVRCREDHFVDLTAFYHTCHYLRAWAYARVVSPADHEVTLTLTTNGPADVWLNGQHIHRQEHFSHQIPCSVSFRAVFREGHNEILVRFEEVAEHECPYVMALQVVDLAGKPDETGVFLPTHINAVARREVLEKVFYAAYLDQDVYVYDDNVALHWPEDMAVSSIIMARFQSPDGRIYGESERVVKAGQQAIIGIPYMVREGRYEALLMPPRLEYYEKDMRITRRIGLWTVKNRYSQQPYGTYTERRVEALYDAFRRETGPYSEIAKMAVGRWHDIKTDVFMETIERINRREDDSDFYLIGLLGALCRYRDNPSFPEALREPLEQCALNFKYWVDEPGQDMMDYGSESHQILFHACEVLASQLYPDRVFTNTGQIGRWHREKGERLAIDWLRKRGLGGFSEWDSNCCFERDLLALSHLADLAETPEVYELASVILDKMFFTMAVNSYKGVFGSTHGHTCTHMITGGRLDATFGIERLMWGMGAFNPYLTGTVGLACAEEYQLPPVIEAIAADLPDEMWNRERHTGEGEVNKVTYKTPDYMLCSAQDYHPGDPGSQQHIWQATMGPDAVVFVTHPPCMSLDDSHQPNFWRGNVVLPRVAQWKDVLIAIHKLPDNDWLGFTHAYFPIHAFDEHALRTGQNGHTWAFARQGDGYLALTAACGLTLITRGESAYRELRSYGQHNVWLCHMGRMALDGRFTEFQDRVLALNVAFEGLAVRCATLRGETLALAWEGPLLRNGEEQPITGFKHYENPYCVADLPAEQMEIRYGNQAVRLHFT